MEHKTNFNEDANAMCVDVIGEFKSSDVDTTFEILDKRFEGKDYYRLLIDLSQSNGSLSPEARRQLSEKLKAKHSAKIAFVITRPTSRMLARVVVALAKSSHEKGFFKNKTQALAWLKGDKQK
jgi:hypothetical protein